MVKKFIKYYKPHMKLFILDMVCAFLMAAVDLFYPMISRNIIDEVIPNKQLNMLIILTIVLVALYLLKLLFNYVVQYWGHVVGVRMQYDMRKELFSHLQKLSYRYFDDNKTGQIMSRIVNDLMEVSELAHHGPEDLFISIVMLLGSFIALCSIDLRLTVIIFAFVPILVVFAVKKRLKMNNAFKEVRKKIADINAQIENSISGIRVVKSFTNEDYEMEKFNKGNNKFRESREFSYKAMAEFYSGIYFLMDILNVIVIFTGGVFACNGIITFGDLVAYLLYINIFMDPIKRLASFVEQYQLGMTGFERFLEIMSIQPDIKDKENAVELSNAKGDIEFKNVTFSYNDKGDVLHNISLKVNAGKTLALVGPSGGGKTTLCHLIPRFYDATSGDIFIDEKNIKDLTLESLRRNIGMVQQDVFLFAGTIKENILYGNPEATDEEVIKASKDANIHEFIMQLPDGYDTYVGERGIKLSGGQKQRISIARVFLKNPPILILDEATSALDNATELAIQKSLEKLSNGRTTIVVAHRLSTIRNADEIMVLTEKGIEEKGTHEQLLNANGIYSKLYKSQFNGYILDEAE